MEQLDTLAEELPLGVQCLSWSCDALMDFGFAVLRQEAAANSIQSQHTTAMSVIVEVVDEVLNRELSHTAVPVAHTNKNPTMIGRL